MFIMKYTPQHLGENQHDLAHLRISPFLGIHSVSIFADRWRNEQVAKLGVRTWKVLYSLISIAGLALMTLGYLEARPQP